MWRNYGRIEELYSEINRLYGEIEFLTELNDTYKEDFLYFTEELGQQAKTIEHLNYIIDELRQKYEWK